MRHCDVVVVGGGPAGSTVARELSLAGFDAIVLDRADFPRHKVCAGWITPAVLSELDVAPESYAAHGRTLQPITGFRIGMIGAAAHEITYGEPVSYGIRRCELDDFLLRRSGARLELGQPLRSLVRSGEQWVVNDSICTPLLVGAGGHGCPVARHLGSGHNDEAALVVAQEVEFRLDEREAARCGVDPHTPELYFTTDLLGYGWCFRKGDFLNIGLGRLDRAGLKSHVRDFVGWLLREGRLGFELTRPFRGHAYLIQGAVRRQVVSNGCLLVGDSAGLAYPTSGEGIRPAVESALLAARVILGAGDSYGIEHLEAYRELLDSRFGRTHARWPRTIPAQWRTALAERLLRSPWFLEKVVLDRWFLHRGEAPLRSSSTQGEAPRSHAA